MSEENSTSKEPLWTTGRIIASIVVVVLIATIGYTLFSGQPEVHTEARIALPGAAVSGISQPADFDVPTIDGGAIKLSDYRGKVLVLDFWATWCPPCREEIPQLARMAKENRARGVEVIGLHIDDRGRSSPEEIRRFMSMYGVNYPIGMATDEMFLAYLGREDDTIPQTLVFGRDGKLVSHLVGYSQSHARTLDEAVNRALANP